MRLVADIETEPPADRARHTASRASTALDDLLRTQAQRSADTLLALARAAASTPPGSRGPRPTLNVLIDHETFEAHRRGEPVDPRRYRDVVVRTQSGRRLHPDDAVVLLLTTCIWIGCDQPIAWCDANHSISWKAHGPTVPRNGGGLCHGHHHLKERGFQVFRDDHGTWHVIDPRGKEIT
jgi:hypothetical protein